MRLEIISGSCLFVAQRVKAVDPKKIYNQTAVTYNRRFFNNTVGVSAGFYFHYDGVGLGLQQILKVSVNLQKTVYRPKK